MKIYQVDVNSYSKTFWSKVNIRSEDDCWEWQRCIQSKGYGSVGIGKGKTALAHRVAYELSKGEVPAGLCVMHKCDNRLCCNPRHLRLGTIQDNNKDMIEKGRHAKGERNGWSKLTWEQIQEMRAIYEREKSSYSKLSRIFAVTPTHVRQVIRGDYWKLPLAE